MLDHIGLEVKNIAKAKAFYTKALKPLGFGVQMEFGPKETGGAGTYVGIGAEGMPFFWVQKTKKGKTGSRTHVAFGAANRKAVKAFYTAAIKAGGKDNGKPGLRPDYHPNYYAAFVRDPDGNNIEAVCHKPE